ncbi:ABC-type multidrug transport system, ATPase and permease component [Desulfosporosinus orientis DSM 765]|uniref:ABC-type multidrug transport system, ATPase and permease component n=1 Tax=Desulfosporosinus orientis (strain ATCC 19365 / DSM 765 / NCIMB 8382 / VKM B-1628 / Singapore I) TaxID=768706 RepID=G7W6R4_DESOD|nr:ATP-binding cassette domain-containing protein [Desulfosporosinus orientis]AET69196.1 ABC-type multidrug transport system, ATPase and permease component [Desulfosporosinus orientis DSM 765]
MKSLFRYIVHTFYQYKLKTILFIGSILIYMGFFTFFQMSIKLLVDYAIVPQHKGVLFVIVLSLVLGVLLSLITGVICGGYMYGSVKADIISSLNLKLYTHLQKLSIGFFYHSKSGDILARFNTDLQSVDQIIDQLPMGLSYLLSLLASAALLFYLDWKLAVLTMIGLPLFLIVPKILESRAEKLNYSLKAEQAGITSAVQENLSSQIVVKAYSLQNLMVNHFRTKLNGYNKAVKESFSAEFLIMYTTYLGVNFLNVIILSVGAVMAFNNALSVGSLLAFNTTLINMTGLISSLTWLIPKAVQASSGMKRIQELLNEKPLVINEDDQHLPLFRDEIRINNLSFCYKPQAFNLAQVSLTIPKGSYVAFVGSSGSGKSTLINLIMRFYDPYAGSIIIDGFNIRQVTQDSLRAQMGIVFQENILFNTSIRENIRLGNPEAKDGEVEAAAQAAEIHSFIQSLPEGYNTHVGERGGMLSGGQRQRIAIARAIVRNPQILILDEATSALDPANEAAINKTIKRLAGSRTVISVTHRLSSAKETDRIYIFDKGTIIEEGKHEELLNADNSLYKSMWRSQNGFAISEDGFNVEITGEKLKDISLFKGLDDKFLDSISRLFITEYYPKDRVVITEGDPGDKFYVVVRGKLEVTRKTGPDTEERLAVIFDGDYFGEIALLKNVTRTASVKTLMPTTLISLQRNLFQNLLEKAPNLKDKLLARIETRN